MPAASARRRSAAQAGIGDDGVAGQRPGEVEGLGGRRSASPAGRRRPGAASGIGTWRVTGQNVRSWWTSSATSRRSCAAAEISERAQLVAAPDPAAGVVRRAEHDDALAAGQRGVEGVQVHRVAAVLRPTSGDSTIAPAVGAQHPVEGMIDRGEQDHAVARLGEGLQAEREGRRRRHGWSRSWPGPPPSRGGAPSSRRSPPCRRGRRRSSRTPRGRSRPRSAAVTAGGGRKSMSATHIAMPSVGRDAVDAPASCPTSAQWVPRRSMTSSKSNMACPLVTAAASWGMARARLVKARRISYLAAMAIRPILIHPDPRLRKVAEPVEAIDAELRTLAGDMLATMYEAPGIGLAATQLGVLKRMFVMDCAGKDDPPQPMVLLNPEIVWRSEETETSEEGCLSIPDVFDEVTRAERVRVRWLGLDGRGPRAGVRRPLGDLRPARDRPSRRQAVHRLPERAEAHDDHLADEEAEEGEGAGLSRAASRAPRLHGNPGLRGAGARGAGGAARGRRRLHPAAEARRARAAAAAEPGRGAGRGAGAAGADARDAARAGGGGGAGGARRRGGGGGGLRADPAAAGARRAGARLPQHPRVAAAALARGGADPAGADGGRCRDRRLDHGDGGGARHRAGAPRRGGGDRAGGHRRDAARPAGAARGAADRRGAGPARGARRRRRSPRQG